MNLKYHGSKLGRSIWIDEDYGITIEEAEITRYRMLIERHERFIGWPPTLEEARFYHWMSGWESSTVKTMLDLIEKANKFGHINGTNG